MSNYLESLVQDYPILENPITEYLQSDPNDSEAEARLKMTIEGFGLGIPFEYIVSHNLCVSGPFP